MNKQATLLKTRLDLHVSANTIVDLEEAIINAIEPRIAWQQPYKKLLVNIYRLSDKSVFLRTIFDFLFHLVSVKRNYFIVLMGMAQIRKTYPYFLFKSKVKTIYLFDCWEKDFERTEYLINRHQINTVFFSAKQSAEYFKNKLIQTKCLWLPEGISAKHYQYLPAEQKSIDVLYLGRRYDLYHNTIVDFCKNEKLNYLYENPKGKIIFTSQEDFYKGLAQSKISICFSSDVTHPERSGKVSTMTQRYLQSMLSKCLIIGNLPFDMKDLFSYNPIIEADLNNPCEQLQTILKNYSNYLSLIERNYQEVLTKHQWVNRVESIKQEIMN